MKALKIIVLVLVAIAALLVFSAWRIGLFAPVHIVEKEMGPYYLIYDDHKGPYQNIYQTINKVRKQVKEKYGLEAVSTFGQYIDDPKKVKPADLRALAGVVVGSLPDSVELPLKMATYDSVLALVSETDVKTKASYMIGPFKVYPKFNKYIKEHGIACAETALGKGSLEIYTFEPEKIIYVFPITKK